MSYAATQIVGAIPRVLIVYKCPSWLVLHPTPIAGNTNNIECFEAINHLISKEIIVYPDIVVNEDKNFMAFSGIDACIEHIRQAALVLKRNVCNDSSVLCKPP